MNASERAKHYLKIERCYKNPDYLEIDEMIKPIVEWFNSNGYITLHSCAGHEDCDGARRNFWYILFVATKPIKILKQKIKRMPYDIKIVKEKHSYLKRVWTIYMFIEPRNNEEISKRNKEVFDCLKK